MRRIVTGTVGGRSTVILDDRTPPSWADEVWSSTAANPLGQERAVDEQSIEPEPGGSVFRVVTLAPHKEIAAALASIAEEAAAKGEPVEVDADGFHKTNTLDYTLVLDGPVELLLDDMSVVVEPGEAVVQRNTNHAWRNHGNSPIRLVNIMFGLVN